jgi:hypothetical protein
MLNLTRRNALLTATCAGAAFGLSLSPGAHSRDPLARNDGERSAQTSPRHCEERLRRSNPALSSWRWIASAFALRASADAEPVIGRAFHGLTPPATIPAASFPRRRTP